MPAQGVMPYQLRRLEVVTSAGGAINADRCGVAGAYAWVIDGATDVGVEPLVPGGSDAAWFAELADARLAARGGAGENLPLDAVLTTLTSELAEAFARERRREPTAVHEHPSAAAIFVRLRASADSVPMLDVLSLADCQLVLAAPGETPVLLGDPEQEVGDPRVVAAIESFRSTVGDKPIHDVRTGIWPQIRSARDRLNQPDGYAALSVLPVPGEFICVRSVPAPVGSRLLLATDGFTRLSDVFGVLPSVELLAEAGRSGLAAMMAALREMESNDADCRRYRRTKTHDDATAQLLEVIAAP